MFSAAAEALLWICAPGFATPNRANPNYTYGSYYMDLGISPPLFQDCHITSAVPSL